MDARLIWLLVIGGAFALFGLTAAGKRRPARVLLVGDSLGVGLASPLRAELKKKGTECSSSVRGSTIARYWLGRVPELLRQHRPTVVLFSLGANDCRLEESRACADFRRLSGDLAALAAHAGARPVFLVPGWLAWAETIRERLTVDAEALEAARPVELQPDHIHPTAAGYRTWAAEIAENLP